MQFFTALLSVLALAVSTTATSVHVAERKLVNISVPITQPSGEETYRVGETHICCWLTQNIPASAVNQTSSLLLGHIDAGSSVEHINHKHPLVTGFRLIAGCMNFVVPDVLAGDSYFIILLEDPGHRSGLFTIQPALNGD